MKFKHLYVQIYTIGFRTFECFTFLLPAIHSSLNIRFGILGLYFIMHSIGLHHSYEKWKQSIINQFDDRKEDSGSDTDSIDSNKKKIKNENTLWKSINSPSKELMFEVDLCDIESLLSKDSPLQKIHDASGGALLTDISANKQLTCNDSDYSFVE